MNKKHKRRLITLLLSLTLIISYMPTSFLAYAVDDDPAVTQEDPSGGGQVTNDPSEGTSTTHGGSIDGGSSSGNEGAVAPAVEEEEALQEETDADKEDGEEEEEENIKLDVNFKAGADLVDNKYYVKKVENNDYYQQFQYHISLDINRQVYSEYNKESIEITIPFSILKHMDWITENNVVDGRVDPASRTLDNSSTCCYLEGSVVKKADVTDADDWYYEKITKNGKSYYVIRNNKNMPDIAANTIQFDVIYQTVFNAYQYADFNKSNLESCDSLPFDVSVKATSTKNVVTEVEDSADGVYMDTTAVLSDVKKELSTTWEKIEPDENGDDENYLYLLYRVRSTINGSGSSTKPTQQYVLTYDDSESNFTTAFADWNDDGQSDEEFKLVGYSDYYYTDESRYKLENNTYRSKWEPERTVDKYVLIKVKKPDSLTINYKLVNNVKVTLHPICGADSDTTKNASNTWAEYYKNTSPTGRFMIHKWANNNYDAPRHSRTDAYGNFTAYQTNWGHMNNELDMFNSGTISELNGFRYFIWYEGYSVRYTPYKTPHKMTYSFEDQDIGLNHNINGDTTYFQKGYLKPYTVGGVTKAALDPADYYFSEVDFYPEAQNATYNEEKEKWIVTKEGNPFEGDEPIIIEAKFGSKSNDWTEVARVRYNKDYAASKTEATGEIISSSSAVDVSFGEYEGEKTYTKDTGFIIKFKNKDCVAYRIKHTNDHYYFMCNVKPTVNLKNSTFVKGVTGQANYLYVNNIADMNVYDDSVADAEADGRIFNFERDAKEGGHLANRIAAAAAVTQNNLLNVNKYLGEGVQSNEEQLYRSTWMINARGYKYAGICPVGITYPVSDEILNSGTFFDILPRGADFDERTLKVYNVQADHSYFVHTQEDKSSYNPSILDDKYLLTPGDDYTYELITGTYNGHSLNGLTMLKITINKKTAEDDDILADRNLRNGYTAVFDTVSYYEDLDLYGNTLLNAVAFRGGNGTSYHEWGYADNPRLKDRHDNQSLIYYINDSHPDKKNVLDALTDLEPNSNPYWFGYDYDSKTVYYNLYNLSGLSKRVKLEEESTWGISREVEPGGNYQYRIRYATDDKTTASDVILYDKIEGYVDPDTSVGSEWYGTLNSMKLDPPRGVTVPVKYYISDKEDAVVNGAIDLTDGSIWEEVQADQNLSGKTVKWVAADTKGFTLQHSSNMSLILNMTAPSENTSDKVKPTTYNDSHVKGLQQEGNGTTGGTVLSNVSNQTQVIYSLGGDVMIEKVDELDNPIRNVTFVLEGTSSLLDDAGKPAAISMTATTDKDGRAVFKNVPISGTGYYTLAEEVPSGYVDEGTTWKVEILPDTSTRIDGEDKTGIYLRVVNKEGTEISVEKKWLQANGRTTAPSGATVTLTLYADGVPTDETVVLDGRKDNKQAGKAGYEYEAWKAKFTGLPKYKETILGINKEIKYTVKETTGWGGYTISYEGDEDFASDGGSITNTEETIELCADKAWLGLDGNTEPPEGARVTFTLVRRAKGETGTWLIVSAFDTVLDGTADEPKEYGGYESEPWKAVFKNAPKYGIVNGQTVEYEYKVYELIKWEDYKPIPASAMVENGGTITNRPEVVTKYAYKRWENANGSTTPPQGATVTLTLYADGNSTGLSCVLDGTADDQPENTNITYCQERANWSAYFLNLPKYKKTVDGESEEIVYTIKETAGWPGFTMSPEGPVESKGTITNIEESTEITAEKKWEDTEGDRIDPPAGARITFTLVVDGVESTNKIVILDGTADTEKNSGYEYEAWKAKFPKLPKYKIVQGEDGPEAVEIAYTIKETVTYPGYRPSQTNGVTNGGVIINRPEVTEVTVEKEWNPLDMSGNAPDKAEVTFTLFADGVESEAKKVVLDGIADTTVNRNGYEYEAWKAKFPDLPKYKVVNNKEVEIKYTVKETGTWPGYKVSYGEDGVSYAVDGGKITNSEEMTSLSVTKKWENIDGSTTPPTGAEVTFTLYADGAPTNYTVTLDGEEDTESIMQGGQESEAWKAVFVRLPKYRVNDKDELVEIEYTVKETGTWPGYTVSYPGGEERTYAVDEETITNTQIDAKGSTPFEGTKNIEGRSFREYDEWTFTVTPLNGAPMNDANGNAIGSAASPYQYVLNKDTGITVGETTAIFTTPAIYFTLADVGKTYNYKITESGNITGVTNDTTVYTVTVTIENNNDGTLKVTKKYTRPKKLIPVTPFNPNIPGGRILDGYEVGWLNNLELEEQELKPFNPGTGEINPGNGGTIQPFDPGTPGGGLIDEKLVEETEDAEFTNVYTPPELEITKKLDGYVDAGTDSNVTLAFEVKGYVNGADGEELAYHNYVGMTFSKNDVDPATGLYQKTVRLTGLQDLDRITVTEVYSGNYKPGQTGPVPAVYKEDKHLWVLTLDNSHNGYTPGSGVVNKYKDGNITSREGLTGSGGEPAAGNEGN